MNFLKSLVIASAFVSVTAIAAESTSLETPAQQSAPSASQEGQKLEEASKLADASTTTTTTTKTKKSKKKADKKAESEAAQDEIAIN